MLNKILIQNFQCHDRLKVDLDQVTSVIGPSDAGKSALIRSLRWLAANTPQGDEFVQDGAKGCTVVISVDGHDIRRKRGKGVNEYILDEQVFKAFGNNVPDPIVKILQIGQLNFQNQHDSPFWFSETAGQVSRNLNAIVDLELIDKCLFSINRIVNRARTEVEIAEDRLRKAITRKKELRWVVEASKEFEEIERLESENSKLTHKCKNIEYDIAESSNAKKKQLSTERELKSLQFVLKLGGKNEDIINTIRSLNGIIIEVSRLEKIKKPDTKEIDKSADDYQSIIWKVGNLANSIHKIRQQERTFKEIKEEIESIEEELHTRTEGVCPLCGNFIKE